MNRFDIINRIGDKYRVGNTETGEFSYAQALKTVGKDIKESPKIHLFFRRQSIPLLGVQSSSTKALL